MNPETSNSVLISFGVYQLDTGKGELRKFDTPIRLQPQPFKLLVLLTSRPGEIVTREQIQEEIWGRTTFVDFDRGLNHCIRQIRAVLGDDASAPRYIETLPRRGYRFIAPVKLMFPEAPSTEPAATLAAVPLPAGDLYVPLLPPRSSRWSRWIPLVAILLAASAVLLFAILRKDRDARLRGQSARIMVAVLPFQNLTGDPGQDYLSDGVTDEMIVHLGKLSPQHLAVIARTSSMNYKGSTRTLLQISRELGVEYFLEGTVKRFGPRTRITAQLVRSSDQTQLWADSYDGEVNGERILGFQQSVASRIAQSLSVVLPQANMPRGSTGSQVAYESYLKGRYEWSKRDEEGFRKAIEYFQAAIALDPKYAQPYAGLADCYNLLLEYYERRSTREAASLAKNAAITALSLDPTLSESRASLAFNLWRYEWKFSEADAEFHKALDLNPNNAGAHHWYGLFLASRGRFDEARRELAEAQRLDPLSLIIITNVGWVNYYARNYDAAIANYQEALNLDADFLSARMKLAWAYEQKSAWKEALVARQRFYVSAGHPAVAQDLADSYRKSGYPGVLHAIIAETEKVDARQYYPDYDIAKLYAMVGDLDMAFTLLEHGRSQRSGWLVYLAVEPAFDKLRSDPRFAQLIEQTVSGTASR